MDYSCKKNVQFIQEETFLKKKGCYLHSVQHSYERLSLHSRSFESYKVDLQNVYS